MCSRCASLCHVKLTKYVSLAALCVSAMHSSIRSIAVQRCTSSYWHRHSHRRPLLRWPLTRRSSHHSKLLDTVTIPYHEPQTVAAAHSAAARHSRSVSSTKTRARDTSSIIKRENRSCSPLCGIERYREHILGRAKRGGGCDAAVRWSGQRTDSAYRLSKCSRR